MYALEWWTVSALTRGLFWCLFPELRSNSGNKHQNNTLVSAETVGHSSTYIISFLIWHNESINDDKNDDFCDRPCVSHAQFSFCWWHHNLLLMTSQWPDNCDAITWIVISNSWPVVQEWSLDHTKHLSIFIRVIWLYPSTCEATLKYMGKIDQY